MATTIPVSVNFTLFYAECVRKGIKVQSRFVGVYIKRTMKKEKGRIVSFSVLWCAKYERNGHKFVQHFPFTYDGEVAARQAYLEYLKNNKIQEWKKEKRVSKK